MMIWRNKFACVRQNGGSDCGTAALATIAKHFGRDISPGQLHAFAGTDRKGTTLRGLIEAAKTIGFSSSVYRGDLLALEQEVLPVIAPMKKEGQGHYIVLHKIDPEGVLVADPAEGIRKLSREEFETGWTGLWMEMTVSEEGIVAPETSGKISIRKLLAPHRGKIALALIAGLLFSALGTASSFFMRSVVDSIIPEGAHGILLPLGIGMSLLFSFQIAIGFLRKYVSLKMGKGIETALFGKYLEKITRLPMRFFGMHTTGDIVSRASDTEQIQSTLSSSAVQAVLSLATLIGVMGVLFVWNAGMALVALVTLGFITLLFLAHLSPYNRIIRKYKEAAAHRHSRMIEDILAMETIKAFGMADRRIKEAGELQENYQNANIRLGLLSHSAMSVTGFVANLAGIAALCMGAHFVINGTHSLGDMMFFYMMVGFVIGPVGEIAGIFMGWRQARVAMTRFEEILQERPEESAGKEWSRLREGISLEEVSFHYGFRKKVLDGINMKINRGERIALVGESGSGKTTLAKLLVRFHDPIEGEVLFDGKSSREIAIDSLRSRVIYIPQDPFVFNMSIRENIASARPDASLEEIIAVARDARLDDFISGLPDGYDTLCGENGKNLSGGQQQRLAIARTLLADPDVVIFDEATCHLDVETERTLYETLETHLKGKTVILIAHRLNTILQADRIFFLKDGRIAEEGSHRELMATRGHYAKLWTRQELDLQEKLEETHRRTSTGRCTRVA